MFIGTTEPLLFVVVGFFISFQYYNYWILSDLQIPIFADTFIFFKMLVNIVRKFLSWQQWGDYR